MKTVIVLAMHGIPPKDFSPQELAEFFRLRSLIGAGRHQKKDQDRYTFLEQRMRNWPRNEKNDPFHAASRDLASNLSEASECEVIVGYNEFCAPSLEDALKSGADKKADKIVVATPMMTRGGEHAEKEIPMIVSDFGELNPDITVTYAWPFDVSRVTRFLYEHIASYM